MANEFSGDAGFEWNPKVKAEAHAATVPWKFLCDEARGMPRCLVVDDKGCEIASVNPYREQWSENAQLIAAAPALLKACRDMIAAMNDYECGVDDPPTIKHRNMMLQAMKAVKQATKSQ